VSQNVRRGDGMKMRRHSKKRQEKPTVKGLTKTCRPGQGAHKKSYT
jgi:hypothetical protein